MVVRRTQSFWTPIFCIAAIRRVATDGASDKVCSKQGGRRPPVHAAFYLWYGNPEIDGRWLHWDHKVLPHWDPVIDRQHDKFHWRPPDEHHAPFRPKRGLFSARNNETLRGNFQDLKAAGVDSAMLSWWGRKDWKGKRDDADSGANTDELVPAVLEAARMAGVYVSFHIEPYGGRTPETFLDDLRYIHQQYGSHPAVWREGERHLPVFWLYDVSAQHSRQDVGRWRASLDSVRGTEFDGVFFCLWIGEQGDEDFVRDAGFDGSYTYFAALGFTPGASPKKWKGIDTALRRHGKKFVPAVGPGYDDTLIRPWNAHNVRGRRGGGYYDAMWKEAVDLHPHAVSITSYNEWGEGTQIEPAVPYTSSQGRRYQDYSPDPPEFYLTRTRAWIDRLHSEALDTCDSG
eukprot:TRINITY_DN18250_c0_g1_i1.p1 TRINITY_DN18250_c0_g1~~TRINITY_DN18250_c0_g1_i1.p1  ORF type:complete len:401 (+),score=50.35 TRINITY_DN18250_c0_g1_i1:101-1303(+)